MTDISNRTNSDNVLADAIDTPTFADTLTTIDQCKGNYRQAHNKLVAASYAAWWVYSDAPEADKAANKKAIDEKCETQNITAKNDLLLLMKLTFGANEKKASAMGRVIQILKKLGVAPDDSETWLGEHGGANGVLDAFNADGKKKEDGQSKPKASTAKADEDAQYIEKAKAALKTRHILATLEGDLGDLGDLVNSDDPGTEYTAIMRMQDDGSLGVVALVRGEKAANAAYAAHGRTL